MDAQRWKQIDELLDAALDLPASQREEYLSVHCNGDEELRREVLLLIKPGTGADEFLETSAFDLLAREIADDDIAGPSVFIGKQFGVFRIEKQIGSGGMGEVYLADDPRLGRKVALKFLPLEFLAHPERVKRFELESRAAALVNHPHIVTIHDVGVSEGISYIATEFVEGMTARELIDSGVDIEQAIEIVSQVCDALAAAHRAGIVHRDIKPENIMVRPDGYVKVLDFGLAKLNAPRGETASHLSRNTVEGAMIGTPAYMSPEQIGGEKVDHRTDLWSIGVVLYQLITGQSPFKRSDRQETFRAVLSESPPLPSASRDGVTAELDNIVVTALEKDPDRRYQTADQLSSALRTIQRQFDLPAPGMIHEASVNTSGRWVLLIGFLSIVILVSASVIWFYWLSQPSDKNSAADWTAASKIQLTDRAGIEMLPTLAPDGKSFVFTARSDRGDLDLFSQRIGDKAARNITENSAADDTQPSFSPDGERIAFRSERQPAGIYVASSTGENARRVADVGYHPAWSPDGKEILVSTGRQDLPTARNSTSSEVWRIDLETGARRLVVGSDAMQPTWSPDGKFIAYWFYPPSVGRCDIGIVPMDGGEPTIITKDGTKNWNPVWSPDGRYLYFASDRGGTMSFWRAEIADGRIAADPVPVVTPAKYSCHLSFSRDGKRMAFVSMENRSNIQTVGFDPESEKTIGEPTWVTQGDREVIRPELSPDGTQFVYQLSRRTQDDIVIIDRNGAPVRDLTDDAAFDRYPHWSPDGRRIAFVSDRSGVYEVWTINADGTDLKQVTFTGKSGTSFPIWSPDGQRLLFRATPRNYIVDLNKDWDEQKLDVLPDLDPLDKQRFVAWGWSSDGKSLVGTISGAPMSVGYYSIAEGRYARLGPTSEFPVWLPDAKRFIYAHDGRLLIANIESNTSHEVAMPISGEIQSIGVSNDGKLIYFSMASSESDVWLLDSSGKGPGK